MKSPQFLMLIPFLKRLMVETSAEAIHQACTILDENGIQYRIQTLRMRGTIGTMLDSRTYMRINLSQNKWGTQSSISYAIYVRRKDYETARRLTSSIKIM